MLIHLPFLLYVFKTMANHSKGLWSVLKVKWFFFKYYL
jgi:hypothetical protein